MIEYQDFRGIDDPIEYQTIKDIVSQLQGEDLPLHPYELKCKAALKVMDADITDDGPAITMVRLPIEPFSNMEKTTLDEFVESKFMHQVARDCRKEQWLKWIVAATNEPSRAEIYPVILKD